MTAQRLPGVPTRKALLAEARRLGCTVEGVEASGEVRVIAPDGSRVVINNRRKDGTRALLVLLRKVDRP